MGICLLYVLKFYVLKGFLGTAKSIDIFDSKLRVFEFQCCINLLCTRVDRKEDHLAKKPVNFFSRQQIVRIVFFFRISWHLTIFSR